MGWVRRAFDLVRYSARPLSGDPWKRAGLSDWILDVDTDRKYSDQTTIYVDQLLGDDSADGAIARPIRTLSEALRHVWARRQTGDSVPITLMLVGRDGTDGVDGVGGRVCGAACCHDPGRVGQHTFDRHSGGDGGAHDRGGGSGWDDSGDGGGGRGDVCWAVDQPGGHEQVVDVLQWEPLQCDELGADNHSRCRGQAIYCNAAVNDDRLTRGLCHPACRAASGRQWQRRDD